MFQRLFGRAKSTNRAIVDSLYGQIVAAARQPQLYSGWNVPDTPLGRFEMVALHMFLFLHRVRGEAGAIRDVSQDLTDEFFRDVEHSLRELGVGDVGVPKRMKKLARMFYGRTVAYGEPLDRGERDELASALARNVRPDSGDWAEAADLADYVIEAAAGLARQTTETILGGNMDFPPPRPV